MHLPIVREAFELGPRFRPVKGLLLAMEMQDGKNVESTR
jgi:hypothetical protein